MRLRVEAQLAGSLHHPGIVDVFDYGEDEQDGQPVPYLVMPLIDGAAVSAVLAERGSLSTGETMAIVSEVATALHGRARGRDRPPRPQARQHPGHA